MFKNLKLRNRILLGYSVPLLLSIAVVIIVYMNVRTAQRQAELLENAHEVVALVKDMGFNVAKMQRAARGYVLFKNDTSLRSYENAQKEFKEGAEVLSREVKNPKQQESLKIIIENSDRIEEFTKGLISLVNQGKQEDAIKEFRTGTPINLSGVLEKSIEDFEKKEAEILTERQREQSIAMNSIVRVIFVGTLLSVLLAVAISLWIASRISLSISETVTSLSSTSTEIASTVEQHERTASAQAASVSETTTTMDELGASTRRSAEQADAVAVISKQALSTTEEGVKMAEQASAGMTNLKQKVGAIGEQILKLSEQTGQIGGIANMVTDIAGQINMLALNAAVEAVRAGESGKGFSVIAQEVRKLADQGKKSAEKVNTIVTDIQKATNSAVMVTEAGTKTVEDVAQIAQRAGESFGSLSGIANSVYENAQQVSLNMKQQVAAIKQVIDAMGSINAGAKETSAGISQTKIGVQRLNDAAQELKKMV
jgi:methyl-accepting chemotaxis protein